MDSNNRYRGGTWHRYKLGQAQFTRWLKQTADKITPTTASGNAEGKSLSSGSKAPKKSPKKPGKACAESEALVHWRELETMASNIVEHSRPDDIPNAPSISCAMSAKDGDEETRDKNATHEHIIQVLERVLAKFEAVKAKMPGGGRTARGSTARDESGIGMNLADLNNMFEHLEVQASPEAPDDEGHSDVENRPEATNSKKSAAKPKRVGKKKSQKGGKPKQQREPAPPPGMNGDDDASWLDDVDFGLESEEDDEFDYYMMIYCFFEDFNMIRSYICERWCDYYFDRSISLNTLAVITNAAFELFHHMEHDLLLDMRRIEIRDRGLGQYEFMMMSIFAEAGMEHIEYDGYESLTKEESDERIYKDEWDWLASPAFLTIKTLLEYIPPGKTAMIRKSDRELPKYGAMTANELDSFKNAVISDLLFDVACIKALKKNGGASSILPAESELLLGFQDALRNYAWSSGFIFSLQLYVDIRNILEETVEHPFDQLQQTALVVQRGLPGLIDLAAGPRRELRRPLRQRQRELERFVVSDVVLEDKLPRYLNAGLEEVDVEPFYLLKHEPVWAGLLDFRAKLFMNEIGHEFVQASDRFHDLGDFPVWSDMEKFLETYKKESQLRQGIASGGDDPAAILNSFKAIMPTDLAEPKPVSLPLDAVDGQTEQFKQAVRIRQHLSKRYTADDRTNQYFLQYMQGLIRQRLEPEMEKLQAEDVSIVLRDITNKKPGAQPHAQGALPEERRAWAEERVSLRSKRQAAKRKAMLTQLSPIQQIQILEDTVTEQLGGILSINFAKLFRLSCNLLFLVRMRLADYLRDKIAVSCRVQPQYTLCDRLVQLPLCLGEVLTGVAEKDEKILHEIVKAVQNVMDKNESGEFDKLDEEDLWEDCGDE